MFRYPQIVDVLLLCNSKYERGLVTSLKLKCGGGSRYASFVGSSFVPFGCSSSWNKTMPYIVYRCEVSETRQSFLFMRDTHPPRYTNETHDSCLPVFWHFLFVVAVTPHSFFFLELQSQLVSKIARHHHLLEFSEGDIPVTIQISLDEGLVDNLLELNLAQVTSHHNL